nr:immunoglobulin heavy chain junction region [Macaca mulatta]MOX37872.1 immunoglobulin heavy chain junction region [Macaca mulatta]MOX37879.1 immunoglobulin heavy chain junction region [Macaca mulatta]MOX37903.1 immunoglobulin heavy chain junction region [Macaca mulatta]MOX37939.1 immunoglobulin heavy chain junction region [Macaca mulatta]
CARGGEGPNSGSYYYHDSLDVW